ncbi:MAG: hypothetical protein PHO32_02975 [Candidatus Cloacimonetes bacterium]|nr:hypothetical protein [Candidatus Cloacimonadota bacterium]
MKASFFIRNCGIMLLLVLVLLPLFGKYSEEFPLGTYSYVRHGSGFFDKHNAGIIAKMKQLGLNATIMETNNSDKDLAALLKLLDDNGMDAILIDNSWSSDPNDPRSASLAGLSTSNYYRFEAEFTDSSSVKPGDNEQSLYWYGTLQADNNKHVSKRVGSLFADNSASYGYAWKCAKNKDKPGYAYTDLTYRWKDSKGKAQKLGNEFHILKDSSQPAPATDSLYVTFRVKISNLEQRSMESQVLLSFIPQGFLGSIYDFGDSVNVVSAKGSNYGKLTLKDYRIKGSPTDFFDLKFAFSYPELLASKLLTDDLDDNPATPPLDKLYLLQSLLTRLYWHGGFDLTLDYVEIEDQIHFELRTNTAYWKTKINQRLRDLVNTPHGDVIKHVYSKDEPFQPQLSSYAILQSLIEPDLPQLMSATYDIEYRKFANSTNPSLFNQVDLSRQLAKPRFFLPDMYPVKPESNFSPDQKNFIQESIDHQVLRVYRESKAYSDAEPGRTFYPVVQAFGNWDGKYWVAWAQPPRATQKALFYLPLCYAPDGIFSFYITAIVNPGTGAGNYCAIRSVGGKELSTDNQIWGITQKVNPELKFYGALLKNWKWLGATTIMTNDQKSNQLMQNHGVKDISVVKTGKGSYEGYVECGYYLDESGAPAIFAVNRRGDYFIGTMQDAMRYPDRVHPDSYDTYYKQFDPQTLSLSFQSGAFGTYPALYNPLDNSLIMGDKDTISLGLEAGEGKLLKLVSSLPATLKKGKYSLNATAFLSNRTVLEKKASVICEGDLTLLPNCTLVLKKGSTLNVKGKLIQMPGSKIESEGKLLISGN